MNHIKKSIFFFIITLYAFFALFKNDALGVIIDRFNNEKIVQIDPHEATINGDYSIDINELIFSKKTLETSVEYELLELSIRNFFISGEQEIKRIQFLKTPPPKKILIV
jgi:hypothetical protein